MINIQTYNKRVTDVSNNRFGLQLWRMELPQTIDHRLLSIGFLFFGIHNTAIKNFHTDRLTKWFIYAALPFKIETYPHALHPGHGPQRSEGAQGPHGLEGLYAPRPQQRSREVDQGHLVVLVGQFIAIHIILRELDDLS